MQRKIFKSDEKQTFYTRDGARKCSICQKQVKKGEEALFHGGGGYNNSVYWHRFCMEKWLKDNPPLKEAVATTAEEAEKEFERIRRSLLRKQRAGAKTTGKTK
jgi:hypothetical protein